MTKLLTAYQNAIWILYSQKNMNMYQIAAQLGLTESQVSRSLKLVAKKLGEFTVRQHDKRAGTGLKGSRTGFVKPASAESQTQ